MYERWRAGRQRKCFHFEVMLTQSMAGREKQKSPRRLEMKVETALKQLKGGFKSSTPPQGGRTMNFLCHSIGKQTIHIVASAEDEIEMIKRDRNEVFWGKVLTEKNTTNERRLRYTHSKATEGVEALIIVPICCKVLPYPLRLQIGFDFFFAFTQLRLARQQQQQRAGGQFFLFFRWETSPSTWMR